MASAQLWHAQNISDIYMYAFSVLPELASPLAIQNRYTEHLGGLE